MSFHGVIALKFVGTVSLGLLTGLSYSLSTVTVPTLLTLPSARTAAKAFRSLTDAAAHQLRPLSGVASFAFLLAFSLSPRPVRHPYLLYTSLLVLGGRLLTSDFVSPYLFGVIPPAVLATPASEEKHQQQHTSADAGTSDHRPRTINMEASYEVLGGSSAGSAGSVSDAHSDAAGSDDAADLHEGVNGEEIRSAVEIFLKKQVVRTILSGVAFAIAVVGVWGDGASGSAWKAGKCMRL